MNNNFTKHLQWLLRHFITIFSCVLITVLGIAAFTQATTIGTDISTTNLTVTGNASTTGTFNLTGLATFLSGMTITGNATTTGNMNIGGTLDVTATSTFSGRVGIGTATPVANFEIHADSGNNTTFYLSDDDVAHGMTAYAPTNVFGTIGPKSNTAGGLKITGYSDNDNTNTSGLVLRGYIPDTTISAPAVDIRTGRRNGSTPYHLYSTQTAFQVGNHTGSVAYFSIMGSGNVGIGTSTPQYDLHISDATNASSTIAVGDAAVRGCFVMGDSDGAGISYITVLDGVLSATTTKPGICQ